MYNIFYVTITVIVIVALILPLLKKFAAYVGSAISAALALYWVYSAFAYRPSSGQFIFDNLTIIVAVASLFAGSIIMLSYSKFGGKSSIPSSLLLVGVLGTILVGSTINPIIILASWGLLSIASYGVAAIPKDKKSLTNALKYAFMGGLSLQFLIIAILLVFSYSTVLVATLIGFSLFLVAVGFKVGAVPFHMWLPDVYGSSDPLAVSALSAIMKLGPLALVLRVMMVVVGYLTPSEIQTAIILGTVISLLTMTWGNIAATVQVNVQRVLAYSSISHVGYMLMGLIAAMASMYYGVSYYYAIVGLFIYFLSYSISKAGAFTYVKGFADRKIESFKGAGKKYGANSAMFSLSLLNLLGLPPLIGFWGKLMIFMSAANPQLKIFYIGPFPWFTIIAIINSVISTFYYVKIIQYMYADGNAQADFSKLTAPIIIAGLFLLVAGLAIPLVLTI